VILLNTIRITLMRQGSLAVSLLVLLSLSGVAEINDASNSDSNMLSKVSITVVSGSKVDQVRYSDSSTSAPGGLNDKTANSDNAEVEIEWYVTDHLGGTALLLDESGQVVSEVAYYPFGLTRYTVNIDQMRYGFTGKELDASGLHDYGARYYDASNRWC
jgi:hypothetical protein